MNTHSLVHRLALVGLAVVVLAGCAAPGLPPPSAAKAADSAPMAIGSPVKKTPVTNADQLPRRSYVIAKLPSELLEAPMTELRPLATTLERDLRADLEAYDIQDSATLRGYHGLLLNLAMLRGDAAEVAKQAKRLRELQEKTGPRLTTALTAEALTEVRAGGGDVATQTSRLQSLLTQRLSALPWADVETELKGAKASFEVGNPEIVKGAFKSQVDTVARNANMNVPSGIVAAVLATRVQLDQVLPMRLALLAAYSSVVDKNMVAAPAKVDRWTERLAVLSPTAKATPVVIGIWDSGVDMSLFKPAPDLGKAGRSGIAFNDDGQPSTDLLRPLGEAQARWPQLKTMAKGSLDMQSALDTEDARRFKQTLASLKADQVTGFMEDASLVSQYLHGTHVAGIAVEGNPFASVYAVAMHWSHKATPPKPTEAMSRLAAANFGKIVEALKANKVRVVNMSWRYSPGAYEGALTFHGVGKDAEERKQLARKLFDQERTALRAAIASAPDILFVAGSGNENNNADFADYIPAGLELPNLVTVGAVDQSGEETNFSTFGKTVVLHANGFEVSSVIPGGEKMKISGASMAAPQVSNLAAKLIALDPTLTPVKVKAMIMASAEKRGRVTLIHPKATLAQLGAAAG
jgi:subtilisin family serine protease